MKNKTTEEIEQMIKIGTEIEPDEYIDERFLLENILPEIVNNPNFDKAGYIEKYNYDSNMYKKFNNKRKISRDELIVLFLDSKFDLNIVNKIFRTNGINEIYVKKKRDLIIYQGFMHNKTVLEVDKEIRTQNLIGLTNCHF